MARVVGATFDVVPKGNGFAGVVVTKVLEGLVGCMWGCSGRLGRMVRGWDMWLMRRLPLNLRWRALRLVGVGIVDGLRWLLGVCGSIQLFFFSP